jgi:energy-coupling factor transport system permease protein
MLRNIPLGLFYPGTSIIHRLQARTKLLLVMWLVIILVIANQRQWHFAPYILTFVLVVGGIMLSGLSLRELWHRTRFLVVIMFASALFSLFANTQDSRVLLKLGPLVLLYAPLFITALLVGSVSLCLLLTGLVPGLRQTWQHRTMKWLRMVLILAVIVVVLFLGLTIGTASNQPLVLGPFLITEHSAWILTTSFTMIVVLYISSLLLTMTTMPVALVEGITILLSPLQRFKWPVDDFALMLLLALRFIPALLNEAEQLIKAQTARGADARYGTWRERFQSMSMFFLPLIHGSLRRASELATALDARGYQSDGKRTMLHETSLKGIDYYVICLVVIATAGSLFL